MNSQGPVLLSRGARLWPLGRPEEGFELLWSKSVEPTAPQQQANLHPPEPSREDFLRFIRYMS
jgi:hypothetical protein